MKLKIWPLTENLGARPRAPRPAKSASGATVARSIEFCEDTNVQGEDESIALSDAVDARGYCW